MKESNYEKTKKECIEEAKEVLEESIVLIDEFIIEADGVKIKSFLSSFAEKIKEAVEKDIIQKIDDITWNYDDVGVNELEKNTAYIKVSEIKQAIEKDNEIL